MQSLLQALFHRGNLCNNMSVRQHRPTYSCWQLLRQLVAQGDIRQVHNNAHEPPLPSRRCSRQRILLALPNSLAPLIEPSRAVWLENMWPCVLETCDVQEQGFDEFKQHRVNKNEPSLEHMKSTTRTLDP